MISIINVSPVGAPSVGLNQYVLKINNKVITGFEHKRKACGLAQCLRDAADAMDKVDERDFMKFMNEYLPAIRFNKV